MSIRQLHGWKIRKLNENFLPTQTRAVFPSFQDSSSETREAEKINFIFFFLYLLRADLNVLLIKAEATSPHYSPSFSGSLLPSPRRDGHTREVAFRSLRLVTLVHACSLSSFFLPRLSLSPLSSSRHVTSVPRLSGLSSLRFTGFRTTPAGHNTRYPWRRVLPPFTRISSLFRIYFRRRSTETVSVSLIHLHPPIVCNHLADGVDYFRG